MNSLKKLNNKNKTIKQNKSKCKLENIKSKYISQKLFNYLHQRRQLKIIKYNKTISKRININTNSFKEGCKLYSSIEVEIIPVEKNYAEFIHNIKKTEEIFYHIYFNDDKEKQIDRKYITEDDNIKNILIKIDYQVNSFSYLFYNCNNIKSIYFKKFFRNNINNMSYMFSGCSSLEKIDLSNFNTDNVTNMSYMFSRCSSLKNIDLFNFNTNNVTNMGAMFNGCSILKEIDLSNFNINNVTDISWMFSECTKLQNLNISNLNINNINTMINMKFIFYRCSSLKYIKLVGCSEGFKLLIKSQFGEERKIKFN